MKSQKRDGNDSPKGTDRIGIESDKMYDLDEIIPDEDHHSIVVSFCTGCSEDYSVRRKKGKFSSIDTALKAISEINTEWFESEKQNVEWLTYHDGDRFDYYIEERVYFLSVNVFGLNKESLCQLHSHFKKFFELSDEDFKDGGQ